MTSFEFNIKLSITDGPARNTLLAKAFPSSSEAFLVSSRYSEYLPCLYACKDILVSQAESMSEASDIGAFGITWEANPALDGRYDDMDDDEKVEYLKKWEIGEMMKLFIINPNIRDTETNKIKAHIMASVMMKKDTGDLVLN